MLVSIFQKKSVLDSTQNMLNVGSSLRAAQRVWYLDVPKRNIVTHFNGLVSKITLTLNVLNKRYFY